MLRYIHTQRRARRRHFFRRFWTKAGQKRAHAYVWAPIGSRPLMMRDNRHTSAYPFGAICPSRAVGAAIIMPSVNAKAMNEHLREISTQVAPGAHAALICDGAGWHQTGGRLRVPEKSGPTFPTFEYPLEPRSD
jgi:hypothetical protein